MSLKERVHNIDLKSRLSGFTLIELLLVVVIILSLTFISTPLFRRSYDQIKFTAFSKQISLMLNMCRQRAIFKKKVHRFLIDDKERLCKVLAQDITNKEDLEFIPVKGQYTKPLPIPANILLQSEQNTVDFFPDGSTTSLKMRISDNNGAVLIIEISKSKGTAKIYDYKKE